MVDHSRHFWRQTRNRFSNSEFCFKRQILPLVAAPPHCTCRLKIAAGWANSVEWFLRQVRRLSLVPTLSLHGGESGRAFPKHSSEHPRQRCVGRRWRCQTSSPVRPALRFMLAHPPRRRAASPPDFQVLISIFALAARPAIFQQTQVLGGLLKWQSRCISESALPPTATVKRTSPNRR